MTERSHVTFDRRIFCCSGGQRADDRSVLVTELGIDKTHDLEINEQEIGTVTEAVKAAMRRP